MPAYQLSGKSVFGFLSPGVKTNRDEWVFDFSKKTLVDKVTFLIEKYNQDVDKYGRLAKSTSVDEKLTQEIKWSSGLKAALARSEKISFDKSKVKTSIYRPFVKVYYYGEKSLSDRLTSKHFEAFGQTLDKPNKQIVINVDCPKFGSLATDTLAEYASLIFGKGSTQCLPLYRYSESGGRVENVTDWALGQFQKHYKDKKISKEDIFHYVYAVLHHPAYRAKYEINLKREFPRIPFYEGFGQWAAWGKRLMELHLGYESVEAFKLEKVESGKSKVEGQTSVTRLMARKDKGEIEVDTFTTLRGVPAEAWEYRLGTYSALEWILERYKEKKPKDPTIAEKFNTYKFAEYKESVIELLGRVCTVSVETMKIIKEMP